LTYEKQKVQFVCNKEGRGRKVSEEPAIAESDDSNYEAQEAESEPNNNNGDAEKKKKLDGGKKKGRGERCNIQTARQRWL
jgi:hypothetical protein